MVERIIGLCALVGFLGCGVPDVTAPACSGVVCTQEVDEGKRSVLDASHKESWIYFSFATGRQATPSEPARDKSWDLAFRRVEIKSNSGISGGGGVKVFILEQKSLSEVDAAPTSGGVEDREGTGDEPDYAFFQKGKWYDYDLSRHIISPKKRVYVIQATDGSFYKLQMYSYYNAEKASGFPSFTWKKLR